MNGDGRKGCVGVDGTAGLEGLAVVVPGGDDRPGTAPEPVCGPGVVPRIAGKAPGSPVAASTGSETSDHTIRAGGSRGGAPGGLVGDGFIHRARTGVVVGCTGCGHIGLRAPGDEDITVELGACPVCGLPMVVDPPAPSRVRARPCAGETPHPAKPPGSTDALDASKPEHASPDDARRLERAWLSQAEWDRWGIGADPASLGLPDDATRRDARWSFERQAWDVVVHSLTHRPVPIGDDVPRMARRR